ncbi:MAG: hypothetical protein NTW92_02820, partial [Bacteroidetes bacterium]|nr:hypothetical protein [Bacteroidota bacterium]
MLKNIPFKTRFKKFIFSNWLRSLPFRSHLATTPNRDSRSISLKIKLFLRFFILIRMCYFYHFLFSPYFFSSRCFLRKQRKDENTFGSHPFALPRPLVRIALYRRCFALLCFASKGVLPFSFFVAALLPKGFSLLRPSEAAKRKEEGRTPLEAKQRRYFSSHPVVSRSDTLVRIPQRGKKSEEEEGRRRAKKKGEEEEPRRRAKKKSEEELRKTSFSRRAALGIVVSFC